jgi:membrane protease YdiL (CAAX protease family)
VLVTVAHLTALALATAALVLSTLERRARGLAVAALVADTFPWSARLIRPSLLALAAGVLVVLGPAVFFTAVGWVSWSRVETFSASVAALGLLTLVVKILLAAADELVFRGALLDQIARRTSLGSGVILSSALFALAHLSRPDARGPLAAVVYALDGIGFSFAYLATGSLFVPTCWHVAKNLTIWLLYSEGTLQFTGGILRAESLRAGRWIGGPSTTGLVDLAATTLVVVVAVRLATPRGARRRAA